jgi:hypothetical protein
VVVTPPARTGVQGVDNVPAIGYGIGMTTAVRPKIRWFVWAGTEKIPHTSKMAGSWGWDAECECGWKSRTGGATRRSVQLDVDLHRMTHGWNWYDHR